MNMKKIFKKFKGFSLIEIVVAFAIFAIFASLIAQVINLTVNKRRESDKFGEYLENQEEALYIQKHEMVYQSSSAPNGNLHFNFGSKTITRSYQIADAYGNVGEAGGLNYFIADDINYNKKLSELLTVIDNGDGTNSKHKPSVSEQYDARITGSVGINSVKVTVSPVAGSGNKSYHVTVSIDSSGIPSDYKKNGQVTLLFGPSEANADLAVIESIGTSEPMEVKVCGDKGVNIHGAYDSCLKNSYSFQVNFKEPIELSSSSFGENGTGTYYADSKRPGYIGVYAKESTKTNGGGAT